ITDPYIRKLVTGTYSGFHEGTLLTGGALLLNASGDPREALANIEDFKKLNKNTYGKDERGQFAWIDIITAESYLSMRNYDHAIKLAKQALEICMNIGHLSNIAIIADMYGRLLNSPYRNAVGVKELGVMLGTAS